MIPRVYVAGSFTSDNPLIINNNVARASAVGDLVCQAGCVPIVPHETGHRRAQIQTNYKWWIEATLQAMRACDAVVVVPEYKESKGTIGEIAEAVRLGIPVFHVIGYPDPLDPFVLPGAFIDWVRARA